VFILRIRFSPDQSKQSQSGFPRQPVFFGGTEPQENGTI
jgi:hypothetical protein